ncbi:MAG: hypothetical protein RRB22_05875 [Gammaproteobacteria bacterium]|nr:hypothetical protein [Gammaproteobacteria bacterium]
MIYYEKSDIDMILEKIGKPFPVTKRASFEERLDDCAGAFLQAFGAEKVDSPSVIVSSLGKIEKAAEKLVSLTKSPEGSSAVHRLRRRAAYYQKIRVTTQSLTTSGQLEEHIRPSEFHNVDQAIKAVKDLELYARTALADEKKKIKVDKKRNKGQAARQTFVDDLAGLWSDMFDELPGTSTDSETGNKVSGPFVRFTLACYAPLLREQPTLPELKENSVRHHFRKSGVAKLKRLIK